MKRFHILVLAVIVAVCLVQAAAALTYEGQITTNPPQVNALKPGDIISEVSGTIRLPISGDMTFASKDSLEFYTHLNNAKWSIIVVVGGIENPANTYGGHRVSIDGWTLSYPSDSTEGGVKVKFTLTDGVVPPLFPSGDIILVRALELDSQSNQVGAAVVRNGTVINPEALQTQIDNEKAAMGVDTTAAIQKYNTAKAALDSATVKLSSAPNEVTGLLTSAGNSGLEATEVLDQAWAQMTIDKATVVIGSVDGLINEFKVNRSIKDSDIRLAPIMQQREFAAKSLTDAKNLFTQKSYTAVRTDAEQSLAYANTAWNLSLELKQELDKGFALPGLPNLGAFLPILLVVAVVLVIAGIIIYRRKMHWDELG
jgi:hypothetical protein